MKILLLAGEESGIIYRNELKARLEKAGHEVRGYDDWGFETHELAVFGILAVLARLPFFLKVKRVMCAAIDEWRPDVLCTIDYPGMNLKLAQYAKKKGVRTVHVVCPQVWAWKKDRIPFIERVIDSLCCFFPFEPSLFKKGLGVFVGHPLAYSFPERQYVEQGIVAALPGSRLGEIHHHLPTILEALSKLDGVKRIVIPAANPAAKNAIEKILAGYNGEKINAPVEILDGKARETLLYADVAIVASGTATLEAALARCPTVLVYKVDRFLAWFLRHAITGVKHVGLANIIWEKGGSKGPQPMPELLQEDFTAGNVAKILQDWLDNRDLHDKTAARLGEIVGSLKEGASPIENIFKIITSGNETL